LVAEQALGWPYSLWCDAVIFRQRCRNIGRLDLRLSFGKLPTAKVADFWAIFRHTAEIYDGETEAIFRQPPKDLFAKMRLSFGKLPTNTWVLFLVIFRQMEKSRLISH
jgi:hypothetical protein